MGCDIHPFFEEQHPDGAWKPVWGARPHPEYWYESLVDDWCQTVDDATGGLKINTILGRPPQEDIYYEEIAKIFRAMNPEEIIQRFSKESGFTWDFSTPHPIRNRRYDFFAALAGVRGSPSDMLFGDPKGLPADLSPAIRQTYDYEGPDAHTPSWLMVREIIDDPHIGNFYNVRAIREWIPNPDITRMVFWFDN